MYSCSRSQLYTLLSETIKLYVENRQVHGQHHFRALHEAVQGTLDGLDAERELIANGEVYGTPLQS